MADLFRHQRVKRNSGRSNLNSQLAEEQNETEFAKKSLLSSLFHTWELSEYTRTLRETIAKVERNVYIKKQLHKLDAARTNSEAIDIVSGKTKGRKVLGRVGLDQLPTFTLADINNHSFLVDKKLPALELLDANVTVKTKLPTFRESVMSILEEIEQLPWLKKEYAIQLANVFIISFSSTFSAVQSLMLPSLPPGQNRQLILRVADQIRKIKNEIMDVLKRKYEYMIKVGLFSDNSNAERIVSMFRTLLGRKMDHTNILDMAEITLMRGNRRLGVSSNVKEDIYAQMLYDLNELYPKETPLIVDDIVLSSRLKTQAVRAAFEQNSYKTFIKNKAAAKMNDYSDAIKLKITRAQEIEEDVNDLIRGQTNNNTKHAAIWEEVADGDETLIKAKEILAHDETEIRRAAITKAEDPLLQAHPQFSTEFRSKTVHTIIQFKVQSRYLKHKMSKCITFNFKTLDKPKKVLEPQSRPQTQTSKLKGLDQPLQIITSLIAKRDPCDHILESESPLSAGMEFGMDDVHGGQVDYLDANLSRFKEVEELYTEIMKSVDETKLEKDEDQEYVYACPAAQADQLNLDYLLTSPNLALRKPLKPKAPKVVEEAEDYESMDKPKTFRRTKRMNLSADYIRRHKKQAMKKIQSSKLGFKYNYGGYVPTTASRKKKKSAVIITADDFDDYLAGTYCDFLPMMAFGQKREQEKLSVFDNEILDAELQLQEKLKQEEQARLDREQHVTELFKPIEKMWNAQVLDYMSDLNQAPNEKDIDVDIVQTKLEQLWQKLHMPLDQKLDMAIKYGSHKASQLDVAFGLWQNVCDLICERETLLEKIEDFEMTASDPTFFGKGIDPHARLREAMERESLLRPLHTLEAQISQTCSIIKNKLKETVTYKGLPYIEKQKTDYGDIIRRCSKAKSKNAE